MNVPRGNDGFPKFWIPGSTIGNLEISEVNDANPKNLANPIEILGFIGNPENLGSTKSAISPL